MTDYPRPSAPFHPDTPFTLIAGPDALEGNGALNQDAAGYLKDVADRLNIRFYFKGSYDKANRTKHSSFRGPGVEKGLEILGRIAREVGVQTLTDVHSEEEARLAGDVVDCIQIPAFLSRQTDLLLAAGQTGKPVNIKKGQFLSPRDVLHCANKVRSTGNDQIYICERGASFGYNNLVVDMRAFPIIHEFGLPVIFDATHSVQLPGGGDGVSAGEREYVATLARAAVAAGCDGLFMETHPDPDKAPCDGPNMIPLTWVEPLLETCLEIRSALSKSALSMV